MQCKEWDDANSELFKESHDAAVHKISYESKLYELISASLSPLRTLGSAGAVNLFLCPPITSIPLCSEGSG